MRKKVNSNEKQEIEVNQIRRKQHKENQELSKGIEIAKKAIEKEKKKKRKQEQKVVKKDDKGKSRQIKTFIKYILIVLIT